MNPPADDPGLPSELSPSAARRRLGEELRRVREAAQLTLGEAAAGIQRSAPTLSRLENGMSTPRLVDVKALLDHYSTVAADAMSDGTSKRIIDLTMAGREKDWFTPFRDVISGDMTADAIERYVRYEGDAVRIRSFEPELIPGLLQTRDYASAITEVFFPERSAAERRRFVDFRMARQHVLHRPGGAALTFEVVIGDMALRRLVGSPEVMRQQIDALLDSINGGRPNVTVRIVPVTLSIPAVVGGSFLLFSFATPDDRNLVCFEGRGGFHYVDSEKEVRRYEALFVGLGAAVLDEGRSAALLEEVRAGLV